MSGTLKACESCGVETYNIRLCAACIERQDEIRDKYGKRAQVVAAYKPNRAQRRAQAHAKRRKK